MNIVGFFCCCLNIWYRSGTITKICIGSSNFEWYPAWLTHSRAHTHKHTVRGPRVVLHAHRPDLRLAKPSFGWKHCYVNCCCVSFLRRHVFRFDSAAQIWPGRGWQAVMPKPSMLRLQGDRAAPLLHARDQVVLGAGEGLHSGISCVPLQVNGCLSVMDKQGASVAWLHCRETSLVGRSLILNTNENRKQDSAVG